MSFSVFQRGMSEREYTLFRDLVHRETGIALGANRFLSNAFEALLLYLAARQRSRTAAYSRSVSDG